MTENWTHVGDAVRQRRNLLGISQGAGGVSSATWRKIEKAIDPPYRPSTVAAVCRVLGWSQDSFELLLAGEEPVETEAPATTAQEDLERRVSALEAEVGWIKLELAERDALNDGKGRRPPR